MNDLSSPEIQVIPEKYYGAALKARLPEQGGGEGANGQKIVKKRNLWIALAIFVFILGAGGAFVYFNPSLISPVKPAVKPVEKPVTPLAPVPPSSPSDTRATSTNPQSVALTWIDTAANESGFRIERAEAEGSFTSITNLPPNSTSFLDNSVISERTYRYRIIALNQSGESAPSPEALAAVQSLPPPPPEQPKLPPAGLDTDSDGLADLEEALFGTEPRNPDTDLDGFLDGNEVFHLYNPNGRAPSKLIDAKLVQVVDNPVGWSMQVPAGWETKVLGDGLGATLSSVHGEVFKMSIEDNAKNLPLLDWYLAKYPDLKATQVMQYRSKQGYEGIIGADVLSTFIPWGNKVFVLAYELGDQIFINYRTTYSMILNSLILKGLPQIIVGTQTGTLPFEPAATTPGIVTQPQPLDVFPTVTGTQTVITVQTSTPAVTSTP